MIPISIQMARSFCRWHRNEQVNQARLEL